MCSRWLDRCLAAHQRPHEQCLFGIVQGGLYEDLRLQSLQQLRERNCPGYAIGGLSGGEEKDLFWKMVELVTSILYIYIYMHMFRVLVQMWVYQNINHVI